MRILFIIPPLRIGKEDVKKRIAPPLGIAYLTAYIQEKIPQAKVEILDTIIEKYEQEVEVNNYSKNIGLTFNEIYEYIKDYNPDLVGIYAGGTDQAENAHKVAEVVKNYNSKIITGMGAIYPTTEPEKVLLDKNVDFIVLGEGEEVLCKFIEAKLNNSNDIDLKKIQGLGFRLNNREFIINRNYSFIKDINTLPFPAREKLNMNFYNNTPLAYRFGPKRKPHTSIITSRGCPANCIFCEAHLMMGRHFRANSPEKVLKEIDLLVNKYGVKEIAFLDDNLTLNKKRIIKILDGLIERKYDLEWMTPNGIAIYALDKEIIYKMKEAGCYQIYLAFESGSQYVLDNIIKKPIKLDKAFEIAQYCKELDIETIGMFVIGFPGESMKQIEETVKFAEDIDCDYVSFSLATPYPGSQLYHICKKNGYLIDGWYKNLVYGFGKGCIKTNEFTPDDVLKVRKEAWKRINFDNPIKRKKVEEFLSR